MQKYRTIVIDPPWHYGTQWGNPTNRPNNRFTRYAMPYKTMSISEIQSLPLALLADDNCELFMWATHKYMPFAYPILAGWGFSYCETLTWCKKPRGTGQGGLFTPTTEFILHGRKGKMPKKPRIDSTWWEVKRTNVHSKKPEFFQDMIETITDEPRLEMFARRARLGWHVWGNEVESDVEIPLRHLTPLALDGAIAPDNQQVLPADVLVGEGTLPEPPRQ